MGSKAEDQIRLWTLEQQHLPPAAPSEREEPPTVSRSEVEARRDEWVR